ncbi:MAG: autotransporter strand-loop-strand O-heptosyltransferase [Gammaproteobacteria bacterium]
MKKPGKQSPTIDTGAWEVTFVRGPTLTVKNNTRKLTVEFIDLDTGITVYQATMDENQTWASCYIAYFVNWKIVARTLAGEVVFQHSYDCRDKRVFFGFGSKCLGDTLAWLPQVEAFRRKHKCTAICSTYWNHLFRDSYPQIEFLDVGVQAMDLYASYRLHWHYDDNGQVNYLMHREDFKSLPLAASAASILGLEYRELRPEIRIPDRPRRYSRPYVCFSPHASLSAKYWHHPHGWQTVIDYLTQQLGYDVVMISRESLSSKTQLSKLPGGRTLKGVIDATGDHPLEERIVDLHYADFYMGVSSGLSWLTWAIDKPAVTISGSSAEWNEFRRKNLRVINKDVCNSCFNNFRQDPKDWNWCAAHQNTPRQFECTRNISPEMVIEAIETLRKRYLAAQ